MAKLLPAQYAKVLYETTRDLEKKDLSEALNAFVQLLYRQQAIKKVDQIIRAFEKYAKKQTGIVELEVTTASPLSEKSRKEVQHIFGGKAEIKEKEDSSVLGGAIIRKDTMILDASIRAQLQELKRTLTD